MTTTRWLFSSKRLTRAVAALACAAATPSAALLSQQTTRPDTIVVSIDDLLKTAMTENLRLRSAAEETRQAQTYSLATRSRFDPSINVGGDSEANGVGGQLTGLLPTGANYLVGSVAPTSLPGQPLYPNALVAAVNQPVLRGFGFWSDRFSIRAVDEAIAASRARLDRSRAELTASVRVAYAVLVERHQQEAIAAASLERADGLLTAYTELGSLDKIAKVDLITAQLGVASRRGTLLEMQRDRRNAEDELIIAVYGSRAQAMFQKGKTVLVPRDMNVTMPALTSVDEAITAALLVRPDVVAARHDLSRAMYHSRFARNALLPTLNVYAAVMSTDYSNTGLGRVTNEPRVQEYSFGVVFSRPLRNAAANAERERVSAARLQAELAVAEAENTVRAEVRAALRDIELGREQVALAEQASQLAREQYQGGRERLNLGLTDIFRVLQYDEQVSRIESAEASARLAFASAVARYKLAIGEL